MIKNIKNMFNKKTAYYLSLALLFIAIFSVTAIYHSDKANAAGELCTVKNSISGALDTDEFKVTHTTLISDIVMTIKLKLNSMAARMYNMIANPLAIPLGGGALTYQSAIFGAIVLFIAVYGIMFMTGMVQLRTYDFLIRIIKIGVILEILQPDSWLFFNDTVVKFFNDGTDEIIAYITGASGLFSSIPVLSGTVPTLPAFSVIDSAVSKVISSKMFVTVLAAFFTGPCGVFFSGLLVIAIWSFLKSILSAMWVYIMSLVMKSLLFGLAPIFIPTILFQRTRHIFDGWVNQLVSASIQPILLFIFFGFFVKLMEGSIDSILSHPICYNKFPEGWRGSAFDFYYWRFMEFTQNGWMPSTKEWKDCTNFPISMVSLLTFLIIAELANRFNGVIMQIAAQISAASTSLMGIQTPFSALQGQRVFNRGMMGGNPLGDRPVIQKQP